MGAVHKADDTRLDRDVALKVLPEALAADPRFCERLTREAKSISALSYPNICTLFDVAHLGDPLQIAQVLANHPFVTRDGRIKFLDFGLAKLTETRDGPSGSNPPTATVGTYMAPEQVRGQPADAPAEWARFTRPPIPG